MADEQHGQNTGTDNPEPKELRAALVDVVDALRHALKGRRRKGKKTPTEHQVNERTMARWTGRVGVFTFFLLLSTIASDWIFYRQLNVMRSQLSEMRSSSDQADRIIALQTQLNAASGFQGAMQDKINQNTRDLAHFTDLVGGYTHGQLRPLTDAANGARDAAIAATASADALNRQVALQQRTFDAAYAPHIVINIQSIGSAVVSDREFRLTVAFIPKNEGKTKAIHTVIFFQIVPMRKIGKFDPCGATDALLKSREMNIEQGRTPEDDGNIDPGDTPYRLATWGAEGQMSDLRDGPTTINTSDQGAVTRPESPWFVPMLAGCASYRSRSDNVVHHTRLLYWLRERDNAGNPSVMSYAPHQIEDRNLVVTRWGDYGNDSD